MGLLGYLVSIYLLCWWFEARFLAKILGICGALGEKDHFTRGEI